MSGIPKTRLETFSDSVLAIAITMMAIQLKIPKSAEDFTVLKTIIPTFLSYVLSFLYIGIYWNNHHHMVHTAKNVKGSVLWANHHLLFWLTLIPFATAWMGENDFKFPAVMLYGFILLMCAISYFLLQRTIINHQGKESLLKKAMEGDWKGKFSPVIYIVAIITAMFSVTISMCLYFLVAAVWLIPDKRIERYYEE